MSNPRTVPSALFIIEMEVINSDPNQINRNDLTLQEWSTFITQLVTDNHRVAITSAKWDIFTLTQLLRTKLFLTENIINKIIRHNWCESENSKGINQQITAIANELKPSATNLSIALISHKQTHLNLANSAKLLHRGGAILIDNYKDIEYLKNSTKLFLTNLNPKPTPLARYSSTNAPKPTRSINNESRDFEITDICQCRIL